MFSVYKHTSPSGKVYIGITSREPRTRWDYGYGYRNNNHFWNAIQKYGWDNFTHEVIATNLSEQEAYDLEINLISYYNSTDPDKGYNHSTGGECITKGVKLSSEQKQKISNRLSGRKLSDQTKQKISESQRGTKGDRVQCVETGKIYRNAQEAHRETGINSNSIKRAASGYYKTAGKLHWRFVDVNKQFIVDINDKVGKIVVYE